MNLSIKDLEVSKELSCEERAAVRGGDSQGNGAVHTIGQLQNVLVPVAAGTGAGSSQNVDVDVDASQYASMYTAQNNGDRFSFLLGLPRMLG
jgi:hypothetical protein